MNWIRTLKTVALVTFISHLANAAPCEVAVTVNKGTFTVAAPPSGESCDDKKYIVSTDAKLTVKIGDKSVTCEAGGPCTIENAEADETTLNILDADGKPLSRGSVTGESARATPAERKAAAQKALAAAGLPALSGRSEGAASRETLWDARLTLRSKTNAGFQATSAEDVVNDLLQTIAAVALDRAKTRGAQKLIDGVHTEVCEKNKTEFRLTHTCTVLDQLTPSNIGASAAALQAALAKDVAAWIVTIAKPHQEDKDYLFEVIKQALLPVLTNPGKVSAQDIVRLLNALATHTWHGKHAPVVNYVFYVIRACGVQGPTCDVSELVSEALKQCTTEHELCSELTARRLELERLAGLALSIASGTVNDKQLKTAFRDALELAFTIVQLVDEGDSPTRLQKAKELVLALVDQDGLSVGIAIGELAAEAKLSPKLNALLTAVIAYSKTYKAPTSDDVAATRKTIIEALVDASTDRSQRGSDAIVSLGVNVGLQVVGYQRGGGDNYYVPQLSLPLGVSVQHVGDDCVGYHFGFFAFDLGQYAAYDTQGNTAKPRWDTALIVGGQAALVFGSIADPIVVGADIRYAPTLFSREDSVNPATGGVFRAGLFVGYYVPFFDFN